MSGKILNWAARAPCGDVTAKAVLLILAEACDDNGETYISQDAVAERCCTRRETVNRAMKRLQSVGFITRSQRRRDDGYRSSDLIKLTLCDFGSREPNARDDNAHENGSHVTLTSISCAPNRTAEPPVNPQIEEYMSEKPSKRIRYPDDFEAIWLAYPNFPGRSIKAKALAEWQKLDPGQRSDLVKAVIAFAETPQARKDGGQWVKGFHLWLRDGLWRDFVPSASSPATTAPSIDWDTRLTAFTASGAWSGTWGEAPGRDGCVVPPEALVRHGLIRRMLRVVGSGDG